MEMYQKPVMEIVELEKVDVLTSGANTKSGSPVVEDGEYSVQ